ncbi:MAG: hypothetical protein V5A62_17325 [Haloarculaceae archaeon]
MGTGAPSEESDRRSELPTGLLQLPYPTGVVVGAGAALVGYFTTVLLTATRATDVVGSGPAPTGGLPGWKAVGWLFYNAHGVVVRFVDGAGAVGVDFVEASGGSLAPLYAVPPAVLLLAGGVTAFRAGETAPKRAAMIGATVVAGYAVALVLGSVLLGASLGTYTATPAVPVLSAVGYPLVFGAMGGVAAAVLSTTPAANR